jgi:hypothetical protein
MVETTQVANNSKTKNPAPPAETKPAEKTPEPEVFKAKGPTHVEVKVLNLKDPNVIVDYAWNGRSEKRTKVMGAHVDAVEGKEGDPENPGIPGLAQSMVLRGQDEEIQVAILGSGPNKGKLFVAAGFRRCYAVEYLAKQTPPQAIYGLKPWEVRAKVITGLSEYEIKNLNARENVRDNLTPPDQCATIMDMFRLDPNVSQREVAETIGKSEGYVSQMKEIGVGLKPDLFRDWRESIGKALPYLVVRKIAQMDKKEQTEAYKHEVEKRTAGPGPTDPDAWVEAAKGNAMKIGVMLGTLVRLQVIGALKGDGANLMDHICEIPGFRVKQTISVEQEDGTKKNKKISVKVHRAIAKVMIDAYNEGLKEPENEEEEEEEEEDDTE